jgi:hypothetical protein
MVLLLERAGSVPPSVRRFALALALSLVVLAGCSSDDDENDETPTSVPVTLAPATSAAGGQPSPTSGGLTPAATTAAAETVVPATLSAANGLPITDGTCRATIPDLWVDDGTGRGTTLSGARYVLFGNRLRNDDAWAAAVESVKSEADRRQGSEVVQDEDFIRVVFPDDRGFEHRQRLGDTYCDFRVDSSSGPIPPEERAFWDAIVSSLAVAE